MTVPGKWDGKSCPVCYEGILHDGTRAESTDYRGERFTSNQPGAYCSNCGDGVVYNDPGIERSWDEFRARVDTQQAAELLSIRARLNLTQDEASKLSGGGHNAFSRYERREAQPVVGVLNLFRLLDRHPSLLNELLPARALTYASKEVNEYGKFVIGIEGMLQSVVSAATPGTDVLILDMMGPSSVDLQRNWLVGLPQTMPSLCIYNPFVSSESNSAPTRRVRTPRRVASR
jgi:HTH-type transcriptional regulator/antitoxin MqsA